MSTNNTQQSWLADSKEVNKGMMGVAALGLVLAPFTGGASLVYAAGQIAITGACAAHEQSKASD